MAISQTNDRLRDRGAAASNFSSSGSNFVARSAASAANSIGARFTAGVFSGAPELQSAALGVYGRLFGSGGGGQNRAPPPLDHMDSDLHTILSETSKSVQTLGRMELELKAIRKVLERVHPDGRHRPNQSETPSPGVRKRYTQNQAENLMSALDEKMDTAKAQQKSNNGKLDFLSRVNPESPGSGVKTRSLVNFLSNSKNITAMGTMGAANDSRQRTLFESLFPRMAASIEKMNQNIETFHQLDTAARKEEDLQESEETNRIIDAIDGKTRAPGADKKSGALTSLFGSIGSMFGGLGGVGSKIAGALPVVVFAKKFTALVAGGAGALLRFGAGALARLALPILAIPFLGEAVAVAIGAFAAYEAAEFLLDKFRNKTPSTATPSRPTGGIGGRGTNPHAALIGRDIGALTRAGEGSNKYDVINQKDTGGSKSYGAYQFNIDRSGKGMLNDLISGEKSLSGMSPFGPAGADGKNDFDRQFAVLGKTKQFQEKQDNLFRTNIADKAVAKFKAKTGIDPGPLTASVLASFETSAPGALNGILALVSASDFKGMNDRQMAEKLENLKRANLRTFFKTRYKNDPNGDLLRRDQARVDFDFANLAVLSDSGMKYSPAPTTQKKIAESLQKNYVLRSNMAPSAPAIIPIPVPTGGSGGASGSVSSSTTIINHNQVDDSIRALTMSWLGAAAV